MSAAALFKLPFWRRGRSKPLIMHCRNCSQRPALPTARGAAAHDGHLAVGTTISTTTCGSQCSDDHCAAERHDEYFWMEPDRKTGRAPWLGRVLTDNGFSRPRSITLLAEVSKKLDARFFIPQAEHSALLSTIRRLPPWTPRETARENTAQTRAQT